MMNPGLIALQARRDRLSMLGREAGVWGLLLHPEVDEFLSAILEYQDTLDEEEGRRLRTLISTKPLLNEAYWALRSHLDQYPLPSAG